MEQQDAVGARRQPGRTGLERVLGPLIRAEYQDVLPVRSAAAARERVLRLLGDAVRDLRAHHEEHEREQEPYRPRRSPTHLRLRCHSGPRGPTGLARLAARRPCARAGRGGGRSRAAAPPGRAGRKGGRAARGGSDRPCIQACRGAVRPFGVYSVRGMAARRVVGIDAERTKLLGGVVDEGLAVHHRVHRLWRGTERQDVLELIIEVIEEAIATAPEADAVGIGIPALMDRDRAVALTCVHLPLAAWRSATSSASGSTGRSRWTTTRTARCSPRRVPGRRGARPRP